MDLSGSACRDNYRRNVDWPASARASCRIDNKWIQQSACEGRSDVLWEIRESGTQSGDIEGHGQGPCELHGWEEPGGSP